MDDVNDSNAGTESSTPKGAAPFDPERLIGRTLADRYEIEQCIGRGGMGVVYLASQCSLDRQVVVKVLPRDFVDDEEALARFEREAVGMSRLQHPHIVSVYDFGHEDGRAYICMEFVEGETLTRRLSRRGALDIDTFGSLGLQILEGISEAHEQGMIHRDIKPGNIMLTEHRGRDNYVKILDFGLAKLVKGAREVTAEQKLIGSPSFLAPEQIRAGHADERSDVYALGVLFYLMLAGERPFSGDDEIAILYSHVHDPPPPLRDRLPADDGVPPELCELVHAALAKDPDARPQTAEAFLGDLAILLRGRDISAPHISGEYSAVFRATEWVEDSGEASRPSLDQTPKPEDQSSSPKTSSEASPTQDPSAPTPPPSTEPTTGSNEQNDQWDIRDPEDCGESEKRTKRVAFIASSIVVLGGLGLYFLMPTMSENDAAEAHGRTTADAPTGRTDHKNQRNQGNQSDQTIPQPETGARDPATGELTVAAPEGGSVRIDDQAVGTIPLTREVEIGEHTVEIRHPDFQDWQKTVRVTADNSVKLQADPPAAEASENAPSTPRAQADSSEEPAHPGAKPPTRTENADSPTAGRPNEGGTGGARPAESPETETSPNPTANSETAESHTAESHTAESKPTPVAGNKADAPSDPAASDPEADADAEQAGDDYLVPIGEEKEDRAKEGSEESTPSDDEKTPEVPLVD